jgi:hypothetical protein
MLFSDFSAQETLSNLVAGRMQLLRIEAPLSHVGR